MAIKDIDPFTGKNIKSSAQKKRESLTPSMIMKIKGAVGNKCEMPGCNHKGHDVHHIRPLSKDGTNAGSNLIVLCANHHRDAHSGIYNQTDLSKIIKKRTAETSKQINAIVRNRTKVGNERNSSSNNSDPFGFGNPLDSNKGKKKNNSSNPFGFGNPLDRNKGKKKNDDFRLF